MPRDATLVLALLACVASEPVAFAQRPPAPAGAPMAHIPGGPYTIGHDRGRPDERPVHVVTLDPFSIDRHEVTNAQFATFLETTVLADRSLGLRLVGDAAPGTADGRVIQGADAVLLMEDTRAPSRRTLVALNDADSRIGIRNGRVYVQPGEEQRRVRALELDPGAVWIGDLDRLAVRQLAGTACRVHGPRSKGSAPTRVSVAAGQVHQRPGEAGRSRRRFASALIGSTRTRRSRRGEW